jgi:3-dehydroquinate dehydratase I
VQSGDHARIAPTGSSRQTRSVMLSLGHVQLGSVPRIAAPLTDADLRAHAATAQRYADIVELRIDRFAHHDVAYVADVCRAARALGLPLIATVRSAGEGGATALDDTHRLALFEAVAPLVDGLDIELRASICDRVVDLGDALDRLVIVSHHDFRLTPPDTDLAALFDAAALVDADVVKIAAYAASAGDADRLLGFLRARRERGLVVIAMGPHGIASRVFFPLLGSLITYGYVGEPGAPGQLPLAELHAELSRYSPEFAAAHSA